MEETITFLDEKYRVVPKEEAYWVVIARCDDSGKLVEEIWARPEKKGTRS